MRWDESKGTWHVSISQSKISFLLAQLGKRAPRGIPLDKMFPFKSLGFGHSFRRKRSLPYWFHGNRSNWIEWNDMIFLSEAESPSEARLVCAAGGNWSHWLMSSLRRHDRLCLSRRFPASVSQREDKCRHAKSCVPWQTPHSRSCLSAYFTIKSPGEKQFLHNCPLDHCRSWNQQSSHACLFRAPRTRIAYLFWVMQWNRCLCL